ncbi:MAG: PASTA domain-containing protein [Oscillospiraceae bacterium]|nr:PASTA domain-containing protein [Oscillospiraceae bacterium]
MSDGISAKTKGRMALLMAIVTIIGFGVLIVRLFNIQVVNGEDYQYRATQQQLREIEISASRGDIYDRNGNIIAKSATAWTVVLSPVTIKEEKKELLATGLSEILDVDKKTVREAADKDTSYWVVKRKVEREVAEEVIAFVNENKITGVSCTEDIKRYYPYGSFASATIGFTNMDNSGAYGIEAYYEKILAGNSGKIVSAKNAKGGNMPFKHEMMYESEDGNSLVLTIDETIQHYLDKNLEIAVKEHNVGNGAMAIAYAIKTGELLGVSVKPDFDPNTPQAITDEATLALLATLEGEEYTKAVQQAQFRQWRNKAISDPYEPGSVFKIITLASALEEGIVNTGNVFGCTDAGVTIQGQTITCWKRGGHGQQTLSEIVQHSCNPAFVNIGQMVGVNKFRKYFEAFGLMETTGVDLPGEAGSIYHSDSVFGNIELASSSIGQSFKVTGLQLISAVSAAVGGGYLYEPYIVKSVIDSEGNVVEEYEPTLRRQVISEETSKVVAEMCEGVVTLGSGKLAYVPGYRIGGKTGTAEKLDKNYAEGEEKYALSFLGFAPIDDPEIAILVVLDEPEEANYGSIIAAPVVGAIMSDVLPYLGIEPQYTEEEQAAGNSKVPDVIGELVHDAHADVRNSYLTVNVVGTGATVVRQVPEAGTTVSKWSTVILYTEEGDAVEEGVVPNVVGLNVKDANDMLAAAGFSMEIIAEDPEADNLVAVAQTPEGDTALAEGNVVAVEFEVKKEDQ